VGSIIGSAIAFTKSLTDQDDTLRKKAPTFNPCVVLLPRKLTCLNCSSGGGRNILSGICGLIRILFASTHLKQSNVSMCGLS